MDKQSCFYRMTDDRTVQPIEVDGFLADLQHYEGPRQLALDEPASGLRVSTIFLGIDFGYGFTEKPILFETMVFNTHGPLVTHRYSTYQAAIQGHYETMKMIASSDSVARVFSDLRANG